MGYLIAALICSVLLVLFIVLTMREARSGTRMFGAARDAADERLRHVAEAGRHANLPLIVRHGIQTFVETLAHEVAQVVLAVVRALERFLVRSMHALQARRESVKTAHAENHLSEVLARFKRRKKREEDEYGEVPVE